MKNSEQKTRPDKNSLNALFYPETICLDANTLKYLLLIYDKVFFLPVDQRLNPGHETLSKRFSIKDCILAGGFKTRQEAHYANMYSAEPKSWDNDMRRLMELYDELEEKGVTVPLEDTNFHDLYRAHPLQSAVDADMQSREFLSTCSRHKNKKLYVPKIDQAVVKGGGFAMPPLQYKQDLLLPSICSERINSTLYFAGRDNLFPVCGKDMYIELLKEKLKRSATAATTYPSPESNVHRFSLISWEIATEVIPLSIISRKSSRDIIRYRDECAEPKERFRNYLWQLEAMATEEPWAEKFTRELNNLVKTKVIPEAQRLRDKKAEIWEKLFSQTIKRSSTVILGLHLVNGFSFWDILSLSTAVGVVGATLSPIMEAWEEKRKLKRNALLFLLQYRNRR